MSDSPLVDASPLNPPNARNDRAVSGAVASARAWSGRRLLLLAPVALVLDFAAIELFPRLDHQSHSVAPTLITWVGVGGALVLTTCALLYAGLRARVSRFRLLAFYACVYNALLVLAKFVLAPAAFVNVERPPTSWIDLRQPAIAAGAAATVLLLYAAAFAVLYAIHMGSTKQALGLPSRTARLRARVVVAITLAAIGAFVLVVALSVFLMAGFFTYLGYVFSGVIGVFIAIALLAAVVVANQAFREAKKQALVMRDVTILTSFFWIGLAFIAVYHVLWFVYLLLLLSLWPLRLLAPPK